MYRIPSEDGITFTKVIVGKTKRRIGEQEIHLSLLKWDGGLPLACLLKETTNNKKESNNKLTS